MNLPYPVGPEVLFAAGYALFLLLASLALELGARRTHRYVHNSMTTGFRYLQHLNAWECPQGRRLWLHRRDAGRRTTVYRADARDCNRCPVKDRCTNSAEGRELISGQGRWPYSEIERFQRGMSLALIVLALFIVALELGRHHARGDVALLAVVAVPGLALGVRTMNKFITGKGNES